MKTTYNRYEDIFRDLIQEGENKMYEPPLDPPESLYDEGWIKELYRQEIDREAGKFRNVGDAVFAILEQLYNSANAIDEKMLDAAALFLSRELLLDYEDIIDEGLCVEHWKQKRPCKGSGDDLFKWFAGYTRYIVEKDIAKKS